MEKDTTMRNTMRILILTNFILVINACTTTQLTVNSEPNGADVVIVSDDGREDKLGQTPLNLTPEMMERFPSNNWRMSINKAGFVKDQLFIETKMFRELGKISVKLTPEANWKEAYQDMNAYKYLNDVSSMSAEIQAATVKGDYGRAESIANSLVTRYPKLSVGWNLLGNIYYLQKRMDKAVESYQKSLSINPDDQVTKGILDRIRSGRI